ncbi:MAG: glycosyltransferase [Chloroflexi bacterium]|nr:glycosyltransferase [Chloroflexota bacterium]
MISVIIPAHNARDHIGECLRALSRQEGSEEYETIVVDDGSTDDTAEVARRFGAFVLEQPHRGPAAARNRGASLAKGHLLFFTDADCQPSPTWLTRMSEAFARQDIVGAKGAYRTRQRSLVARFVQLEFEDKYDFLRKSEYIDFVDTYSACYRREVFRANGGFDENIPLPTVEDVDFSFRLSARGYKMVFVPDAIVYHQHPNSLLHYLRRKFRYGYWRVLIYRRYPGKALADSRTPHSLRIQVGLAALLLPAIAILPVTTWLLPLAIIGLFVLSGLPLTIKALRKDGVVAAVVPLMLLARALAIDTGLLAGLTHLLTRKGDA